MAIGEQAARAKLAISRHATSLHEGVPDVKEYWQWEMGSDTGGRSGDDKSRRPVGLVERKKTGLRPVGIGDCPGWRGAFGGGGGL